MHNHIGCIYLTFPHCVLNRTLWWLVFKALLRNQHAQLVSVKSETFGRCLNVGCSSTFQQFQMDRNLDVCSNGRLPYGWLVAWLVAANTCEIDSERYLLICFCLSYLAKRLPGPCTSEKSKFVNLSSQTFVQKNVQ